MVQWMQSMGPVVWVRIRWVLNIGFQLWLQVFWSKLSRSFGYSVLGLGWWGVVLPCILFLLLLRKEVFPCFLF